MRAAFLPLVLALCWNDLPSAKAELKLSARGRTAYVVVHDPAASAAERNAARELADTLREITGAEFRLEPLGERAPARAIVVGQGSAVQALFPGIGFDGLGAEEIVLRTQGARLLISGGRPRGTLYAVSRFLQDYAGVRWWTPWARRVPSHPSLSIPALNVRARPAFEARDPFWYAAFDTRWAVRNFSNSQHAHIGEDWGGGVVYKGFVHTFYPLVPPEQHFAAHPEWFSLIEGKRSTNQAQLCLSNPELRDFVVQRVKDWLRETPEARIVSVSQNDWHKACQCDACKAMDEAEGSPAGAMLRLANYVAERIEKEFPQVAVDTLAYQYTRKPPRSVKPRPNVIVRLCSIECNFREPLADPSNATFASDIRGWAAVCPRLYVWDYTTDFAHYLQPHPNWFVLGPNLRFFHQNHVRGMFEQGAYQSHGAEMAEMRAWVLAQLLWNPYQDDRRLIGEFLAGYYGQAAAPFLSRYLDLMQAASKGFKLTCFAPTESPMARFNVLADAEELWQRAERAAGRNADERLRVRVGHQAVRYLWLTRWNSLRDECRAANGRWPLAESREAVADEWLALARGAPDAPWTKVTHLNESGLTPDQFVERLKKKP